MKTVLLLLSVVGLALVCAELHGEDQYTEDANVLAVDDSADMEEFDDADMEDSRRAGISCSAGFKVYTAFFDANEPLANGYTGQFDMKICNDGSMAKYDADIKGDFETETEVKMHLHSAYDTSSVELASTSGHYDPEKKCGGASTYQNDAGCETAPYPDAGCEAGDTTCNLGDFRPAVHHPTCAACGQENFIHFQNKKHSTSVPVISHFRDAESTDFTGSTWAAVVFHRNSDGTRMFGAKLQLTYESHVAQLLVQGAFKGSVRVGQNTGVTSSQPNVADCQRARTQARWKVKFNQVDEAACLGGELNWHIHEKWPTSGSTSLEGADDCGPTNTGGHYDPSFGCGGASQYQGDGKCTAIGRGKAENQNQACNLMGDSSTCEYGDLSGKMGPVLIKEGIQTFRDYYINNINSWSGLSVVFHCGSPRKFCGKII